MDRKLAEMFVDLRAKRPELDAALGRMQGLVEDLSGHKGSPHIDRVVTAYLERLQKAAKRNDLEELENMLVTLERLKTVSVSGVGLFSGVVLALLFIVITLFEDGHDVMATLPFLAGGPVLAVFAVFGRKMLSPRLAGLVLALAACGLYYGIGLYRDDPNKDVLLVWGLIGGAGIAALMALSILLRSGVRRV